MRSGKSESNSAIFRIPRRLIRRLRRPALVVGVILLLLGLWTTPWLFVPRLTPVPLAPLSGYHDYPGVLHLHSHYSHDSSGSITQILRVARRHRFRFLVLSDHDTFQAARDGWEGWHEGVLLLVGAEISLPRGHLLVFGVPQTTAEQIVAIRHGEVQPVVDLVNQNGGLGILLYPFLPNSKQRWRYWKASGITGLEVWNTFSNIEKDGKLTLLRGFLVSRLSFPAALSALTKRPAEALRQWDELNARSTVIGTCGTDSHGKYFPYEQELPTLITHLVTKQTFAGKMKPDAQLIFACLRRQNFYFSNDSLYPAAGFRFLARQQDRVAGLGENLALVSGEPAQFVGAVPYKGPIGWHLYRDGRPVWQGKGASMDYRASAPGRYRVEVSYGSPPRPWIFSSPIYLVSSSGEARSRGR